MNSASAADKDMNDAGVALYDVVSALDTELQTEVIADYSGAVNGLQFANRGRVTRVAVAVDASMQAVVQAQAYGADLLIVHHGLFWSGVQPVRGLTYEKYRMLLDGNIAVYSSHLPLDMHPRLGNNHLLANALGLQATGGFARYKTLDIGVQGSSDIATAELFERVQRFSAQYGGVARSSVAVNERRTRRWAICTGGGASSETIAEALGAGVDTMIVGEGPHHTTVAAIEADLCIIYAGHYATETLGVQALGRLLAQRFDLSWTFLHLPTGS